MEAGAGGRADHKGRPQSPEFRRSVGQMDMPHAGKLVRGETKGEKEEEAQEMGFPLPSKFHQKFLALKERERVLQISERRSFQGL